MSFSWKQAKIDAIETKIRRAITMANNGNNPTFKLQHPDWVRDAQTKNYTQLKKQVKEQMEKRQNAVMDRRVKRGGKNQDN